MKFIAFVCYMASHVAMGIGRGLGISSLKTDIKRMPLNFAMGTKWSVTFGGLGGFRKRSVEIGGRFDSKGHGIE